MDKVSLADKMRIQTLCEQCLGAKAIMAAYPDNGWAFSTVKKICQRVDRTGSATECQAGCDRQKSACSEANIAAVIFYAEKSVFKGITFHLAFRCRPFQEINL